MVSLRDVRLPTAPGGAGEIFSLPEHRQGCPHRAGAVPGRGDTHGPPQVLDLLLLQQMESPSRIQAALASRKSLPANGVCN